MSAKLREGTREAFPLPSIASGLGISKKRVVLARACENYGVQPGKAVACLIHAVICFSSKPSFS